MSTLQEIEAAIEKLPGDQTAELLIWLMSRQQQIPDESDVDSWLLRARGAAIPGVTTDQLQALTRGEE